MPAISFTPKDVSNCYTLANAVAEDQSLEFADLCNAFSDAKKLAMIEVDRQLERLGTGRGSAAGYPTIRFVNFDGINRVCRNGRWETIRHSHAC